MDWTGGLDQWTGLVDWTGGLHWWTDIFMLKITFVLYNETSLSCRFSYEEFLIRKLNFLCVDLK